MRPDILGFTQTHLLSCNYPFVKPPLLMRFFMLIIIGCAYLWFLLPQLCLLLTMFWHNVLILQIFSHQGMTSNIANTKKKKKGFLFLFCLRVHRKMSDSRGNLLPCLGNQFLLLLPFCFSFFYPFHFTSLASLAAVSTALPTNKSGLGPVCLFTSALSLLSCPL